MEAATQFAWETKGREFPQENRYLCLPVWPGGLGGERERWGGGVTGEIGLGDHKGGGKPALIDSACLSLVSAVVRVPSRVALSAEGCCWHRTSLRE